VTFRNFRIDDSQISAPLCACPSDYVAHIKFPFNKTQECIILFKTPFITWNKKPTRCHLVLYLFILYKLLNMFRAILCPSSGADDLVVFLLRVV